MIAHLLFPNNWLKNLKMTIFSRLNRIEKRLQRLENLQMRTLLFLKVLVDEILYVRLI